MKTILNQLNRMLKKEDQKKLLRILALGGTVALLMYLHSKNKLYAAEGERILRILEKNFNLYGGM